MYRIKEEIAEIFVKDLKEGILKELLEELENDATLMLDFRSNYVNVYYRGGMICKLEYKASMKCYQDTSFNENYIKAYNSIKGVDDSEMYNLNGEIKTEEDCKKLVEAIRARKKVMNYHFDNTDIKMDMERECKQMTVRENNQDISSNYTIVDTEYRTEKGGQFDMVGVNRKRQGDYQNLKLAIIEMKYGNGAIEGNSGVYGHFNSVKNLSKKEIQDLIEDAEKMLEYKVDLGLIKLLDCFKRGMKIDREHIELIFFISDIRRGQANKLKEELKKIVDDLNNDSQLKEMLEVKIFCPYLAGNVMFDEDMIDVEEFLKRD